MPTSDWRHGQYPTNDVTEGRTVDDAQDVPRNGIDFLCRENQRLSKENRTIRQCLLLVKENCELQTLNYLSHAMAMNDARLRKFLTDAIVPVPTKDTLKLHAPQNVSTAKRSGQGYPTAGPGFKPGHTSNDTVVTDDAYGQSFPELQFSDLHNSYRGNSRSNSYGNSFPEINLNELEDSYSAYRTDLQTPNESRVKWVDPNAYSNDNAVRYDATTKNQRSMKQTSRDKSSHGGSRDGARSRSMERSSKSMKPHASQKVKSTKVTGNETQMSQSPGFYDSLDASHHSYGQPSGRNQGEINRPPMRFSLNPNPMKQDPYASRPVDNRRDSRGRSSNSLKPGPPPLSYKHGSTSQSVRGFERPGKMSEGNRSLHISDLGNGSQPSAFTHYKTGSENRQYSKPVQQVYQHGDMAGRANYKEYDSARSEGIQHRAVSMGIHQGQSQGQYCMNGHPNPKGSARKYTNDDVTVTSLQQIGANSGAIGQKENDNCAIVCDMCQSSAWSMSQNKGEQIWRRPVCKHIAKDDTQVSGESNPAVLVRVDTTFGHADGDDKEENVQFSDLYTIPTGSKTPTPTLVERSVTPITDKSEFKRSPLYDQLEGGPLFHSTPIGHSDMNYNMVRSQRVVSVPDQPPEIMRYMPEDSSYMDGAKDSVFLSGQQMHLTDRSNYKTTVAFEPDPLDVQDSKGETGGGITSYMQGNDVSNMSTLIGSPIASSTLRSPKNKQKAFTQEQLRNITQLDKYVTQNESCYETALSAMDSSNQTMPRNNSDYGNSVSASYKYEDRPAPVQNSPRQQGRCASAPPLDYIRYDVTSDVTGVKSTGAKSVQKKQDKLQGRDDVDNISAIAEVLGFTGKGAKEKVKSYLHRPVDILTSYQPRLTTDTYQLLQTTQASKRMVGEIAFQLDRRVLEMVIAGYSSRISKKLSFRYYGYSLTSIFQLINREATSDGVLDPARELGLKRRFDLVMRKLQPLGYNFVHHAEFTQDIVNKYGLLNLSSDDCAADIYGLKDVGMIRLKLCQILQIHRELEHMMIIFDCLCYLSFEDGRPVFIC